MSCPYNFYKKDESFPRLYCDIDKKFCLYSKKCNIKNRFLPLDNQEECYKMIEQKQKEIPKGSYFIQASRPNIKGKLFLYVVVDDSVKRIESDLTELNQDYVYLKKEESGYAVSLTPFTERKNYRKKTATTNEKK